MQISPAGEIFLTYAAQILALSEEAKRAVDPEAPPSGPLRIGAIESSASGRLPRLLARFHRRYPAVALELTTGPWAQLLEDTLLHKLDGVIVAVDVERPLLKRKLMYREDLVLIASPSLGPLREAADLRGKSIFMWPSGCPYRATLERWLLGQGKPCRSSALPVTAALSAVSVRGPAWRWCPGGYSNSTDRAPAGPATSSRN